MNKLFFILAAASSMSLLALAPSKSSTSIVGSDHDMTANGYIATAGTNGTVYTTTNGVTTGATATSSATQICVYCHTPHQSSITLSPDANNSAGGTGWDQTVPLWNHTTTSATYTMYGTNGNNNMVATPGTTSTLGMSIACLSCHDGTVAIGSIVAGAHGQTIAYGTGNMTNGMLTSYLDLGTDLSGDHPVGIVYTDSAAGVTGSLNQSATAISKGVVLYNAQFQAKHTTSGGLVQCGSCHDVHAWWGNQGGATSQTDGYFLRLPLTGSQLCLTCHNK